MEGDGIDKIAKNEDDFDAAEIDKELIASRLQKDVVSRRQVSINVNADSRPRRKVAFIPS